MNYYSKSLVPSLERLVVVSDMGGFSSAGAAAASSSMASMGSRRFFNAGGRRRITTESSSFLLLKRDMFLAGDIPNLFRGRQTGGCVGSFVPHQCNRSHMMLPYFARSFASSSASQSSGQTAPQEPTEKKKMEGQIISSSKLQRESSLNQFPGVLMVDEIDKNSKTRRGYFEEQGDDVAAAGNSHGHYD